MVLIINGNASAVVTSFVVSIEQEWGQLQKDKTEKRDSQTVLAMIIGRRGIFIGPQAKQSFFSFDRYVIAHIGPPPIDVQTCKTDVSTRGISCFA